MRVKPTSMQLLIILFMGWFLENQISETHGCLSVEREALLAFKSGVVDPWNHLSSWEGLDCCGWRGVRCNNETGRVEKLNLRNHNGTTFRPSYMGLSGEVNSSLLSLSQLKHLDLSMNDFSTGFPLFIASFKKLRYLNLSNAGFSGEIPPQLGNLSTLRYLDLRIDHFFGNGTTFHGKLWWIKDLSFLKYLDLSSTLLRDADDWLQAVNMLTSLQVLRLQYCHMPSNPSPISHFNLTSLSILDLQHNSFNSTLPNWLLNFTSLTYLNLLDNNLYGPIPAELNNFTLLTSLVLGDNELDGPAANSINNLCRLDTLDLSGANIDRDIAEFLSLLSCVPLKNWQALDLGSTNIRGNLSGWLEYMTSLIYLDVGGNFLNGSIPEGIQKLSNLYYLDLSENSFGGVVHETHLLNFTKLKVLIVSGMSLDLKVDDNWVPPFQVQVLILSSCRLGPQFPRWLQLQQEIRLLDLSNNEIAEAIPNWFWGISSTIVLLDLSNNQISGMLPSSLGNMRSLFVLNLASNRLGGFLPILPDSLTWLDFSSNMFSESLPQSFFKQNLMTVLLSNNSISANIPSSIICNLPHLQILDMSNNKLFGKLPNCRSGISSELQVINLSNNNLSGHLPDSLGLLGSLKFLYLNNNNLHGELPSSLQYCPLILLDLGQNKLLGEIPAWVGSLSNLTVLRLMSNMFVGKICAELGQLENLQILDLSSNNLSGNIPHTFGNFCAMVSNKLPRFMDEALASYFIGFPVSQSIGSYFYYQVLQNYTDQKLYITTKGLDLQFSKNLFLEKSIDLSSNNHCGEIPKEMVDLSALNNLNLSGNHLIGRIPNKIGNLRSLESLDLSMNELNGTIPESMTVLTSLSHLNLSCNNLSGRIPTGNQMQTLNDPTIYAGNPYLCGPPTSKNCSGSEPTYTPNEKKQSNGFEKIEIYLAIVLGFVMGFWGVYGVLLIKSAWRNTYFYVIDKMYYRFLSRN